jgi:hypothetical protein
LLPLPSIDTGETFLANQACRNHAVDKQATTRTNRSSMRDIARMALVPWQRIYADY